jgi:hypothetical protein
VSRPRIRTIKPEIFQDEKFGRLPPDQQILFIGLITMADDEGRLRELPSAIHGHVFPYRRITERRITGLLRALADRGMICRYEAAGERLICLPNFLKHQRVNRFTESPLPAPPSPDVNPEQGVFLTDGAVRAQHGKGRERIGVEPKGAEA